MKPTKSTLIGIVILALCLSLSLMVAAHGPCDPGERPEVGTVKSLEGKVLVLRPGGSQYEAKVGTVIRPEETVETTDGARVEIAMEDGTEQHGTIVSLGPNTKAQFMTNITCSISEIGTGVYTWSGPSELQVILSQGAVKVNTISDAIFEVVTGNTKIGSPDSNYYSSYWTYDAEFEVMVSKDPSLVSANPMDNPASQEMLRGVLMMYGATSLDQLTPQQRQEAMLLIQMSTLYAEPMPSDVVTKVKVNRGKVALYKGYDKGWDGTITVYKGEASDIIGIQPPTDPLPF